MGYAAADLAYSGAADVKTLSRRQAFKPKWKGSIMDVVELLREDLDDSAALRKEMRGNAKALELLCEIADRRSLMIETLILLLHYKDGDGAKEKSS